MSEVDFVLDKLQRQLDELRMAWKSTGCHGSCDNQLDEFFETAEHLKTIHEEV